ncbi:glycosyltransferase family 4 protein [Castellaniella sp.]|uniref:glycosyltransferase family 4 protein n=1 Tax=Castellaniella sp. TaxID=1955812 RepID=UPI003C717348
MKIVAEQRLRSLGKSVVLVSPMPPPYGGIAHWTKMIYDFSRNESSVLLSVIDTSPRWRGIHDTGVIRRLVGGCLQILRDVFRLLFILNKNETGVVHLTTSGSLAVARDLLISWILRFLKINFIYHIRFGRIPEIAEANSLEWKVMANVMKRAFTVIAIDRTTLDTIKSRLHSVNAVFMPNCVDVGKLSLCVPNSGEERTAVFLGWVIPAKGIGELIDAWRVVDRRGWKLKIIGPAEDAYKQRLQENLEGYDVEFVGELPHQQAMEIVAGCGLFVLPSHSEGFPNVIAEAMAFGRPIIATKVGAIPEMLDGNCGLLIDKCNAQALAVALDKMLGDGHSRDEMGALARKKATEQYALDVVYRRYMTLWAQADC